MKKRRIADFSTTHTRVLPCPYCGASNDAHTGPKGGLQKFSLTICLYCCGLSEFIDGALKPLSAVERAKLPDDTKEYIRDIQAALRKSVILGKHERILPMAYDDDHTSE